MKNLLSNELHEHDDLYDNAAGQWNYVVSGIALIAGGSLLPVAIVSGGVEALNEFKEILTPSAAIALGGIGLIGYGLVKLRKTSHELADRIDTPQDENIVRI